MFWELALVTLIVAAAAGYLALQVVRAWQAKGKCGGGCSCPGTTQQNGLISSETLAIRPRQQSRPPG